MFLFLTVVSLTLGAVTWTTLLPIVIGLISLSTFIGGGFQMVALKVGSYAFPREQSAMMSGIASGSWSLVNFILLQAIGPRSNLMDNQSWEESFWIIALLPGGRHRGLARAQPRPDGGRAGVDAESPVFSLRSCRPQTGDVRPCFISQPRGSLRTPTGSRSPPP